MRCQIRVVGHLNPIWGTRLDGLRIIHEAGGTSLLVGTLVDQAALHGVLLRLIDLGLALRSLDTDDGYPESAREFERRDSR